MSTPNTDDTNMTTDTEENEHSNYETAKQHIDIEDSVDSQGTLMTEFRQTLQVQSHLEMPGILVQLGHIQRT